VQEITISAADETSMGVRNRNVKRDEQQVGPSGAAINSRVTRKHEVTVAVVKMN